MTEVCGEQLIPRETGLYLIKLFSEKNHIYLVETSNSSFFSRKQTEKIQYFFMTPFQSVLF